MPKKQTAYYDKVLREYKKLKKNRKIDFYKPYDWQLEFLNSTGEAYGEHNQCALICANRIGKTFTICAILTMHLTGDYPDWYEGRRFKKPIRAAALGISGEQIRDVLQSELIGPVDAARKKFSGGGMIPVDLINKTNFIPSTGVRNLLKEVKIAHKSGGESTLIFRSAEQGRSVLQGQSLEVCVIDEESKYNGLEIYGECLSRTMTGDDNRGGLVYLSFTPENGKTPLVELLVDKPVSGQYVATVGWNRAPHLSEKIKAQLLAAIPEHMRSAKTQGVVSFAYTTVFPVAEEEIAIDPFPIPDHFKVICGIDFGIAHYFGAVFSAYDADRDIIYIYDLVKVKGKHATDHSYVIRQKGHDIRVMYPHDGHQRSKGSGKQIVQYYKDAGLNIYRMFQNKDKSQSIEIGIFELLTRMKTGRLKVFRTLDPFFEEFRKYHRDDNGKIVALGDDLMSAFRYSACSVVQFGEFKGGEQNKLETYSPTLNY